jgi:CRISPR-associated endoribonuclease Cas6
VPSRWVIRLAGPCAPIPLAAPMAVVAGWLDDPGPDPVQAPGPPSPSSSGDSTAPHQSARRPWAISPPQLTGPTERATGCLLEIRILDDQLDDRLLAACVPGTPVRLGRSHLRVTAPPQRLEHRSWQALAWGTVTRAWQVRMTSPATFRSRQRCSPWPAPEAIARGLESRWRLLDPGTAPEGAADAARGVWVSDLDGHSEVVTLDGAVVSGFVGRIRYACDGSTAHARTFDALLSLAAFAGIGSHTTFGFGSVTLEDTWRPASRPPTSAPTIDLPAETSAAAR